MADVSTVTIACKLPNGIHLDAFEMDDVQERVQGAVHTIKRARRIGRFTAKGIGRRTDDAGLSSGFALTHGCPKNIWDKWLEANKENPVVTNGLVFAASNTADVRARTRENEAQVTGLEPLDPHNLPREFRGKVEKANRPN